MYYQLVIMMTMEGIGCRLGQCYTQHSYKTVPATELELQRLQFLDHLLAGHKELGDSLQQKIKVFLRS